LARHYIVLRLTCSLIIYVLNCVTLTSPLSPLPERKS